MALSTEEVEKHFEELERIAEEAISDKSEITILDKRRNTNREALRNMKDNPLVKATPQTYVCIGNTFMRLPNENIVKNIELEQERLDAEINSLREGLREKVNALNRLEGKPLSRGTALKALDREEWNALQKFI